MMFDGCFDGQARAARRNRLQQEAVHLAAVDQVHEHFAIVAATGDDRNEARRTFAQVLRQLFDLIADHRGVNDGDADFVLANKLIGLLQRIRVVNFVHATRRSL